MPGKQYDAGAVYRYGFNGKENDNEVKGEGNQQDYGMRVYDPRLGKFLSVDPLASSYPWYTPYQFAGNMPIWAVDVDGLEPEISTESKPKEIERVIIPVSKPKEGSSRVIKEQHVSAGSTGAVIWFSNETQYYHRGSATYNTKGGWYNQESYFNTLGSSSDNINGYPSPASDLTWLMMRGDNLNPNSAAYTRLRNYYFEIGNPDPVFFKIMGIASEQVKNNYNLYRSGYTNPTGFNVEDILGVGLIVKGIFNSLASSAKELSRIQAGSLKEYKSLVKQLSKPGSQLSKQELQQFEKLTEQFGGKLRHDLNPVKGKILNPHVQVEGLGSKIGNRHIWLAEGVK